MKKTNNKPDDKTSNHTRLNRQPRDGEPQSEILLTEPSQPLNRFVTPAVYGQQVVGKSPGGPLDQFSWLQTQSLLQYPSNDQVVSWELCWPDRVVFQRDCWIVTTGAPRAWRLGGDLIEHGQVVKASQNMILSWGRALRGFRSYFSCTAVTVDNQSLGARQRGSTMKLFSWVLPRRVRVLLGPEAVWQLDACQSTLERLLNTPWRVSPQSNAMGLRLLPIDGQGGFQSPTQMISQPVNDGTVQLTPTEAIVLLRDRQTIGGYLRLLNVISADIDLLAQYQPGELIRFELVTEEEAVAVAALKKACFREWCERACVPG